jgi:hypothetical protein
MADREEQNRSGGGDCGTGYRAVGTATRTPNR